MHTDEYEISLYRELEVCRKRIQKIEKNLSRFESYYTLTTKMFVEKYKSGEIGTSKDFTLWNENYEGLKRWTQLRRQYEEMFHLMKI